MKSRKPITWVGSSKKDLLELDREVQRMIGHSLNLVQQGLKDDDSKPLKGFGGGSVLEIVKNDSDRTYRAVYTVRFKEAIYVLHVFQKKSKNGIKTSKQDMDLVERRLKDAQRIHNEIEEKQKELKP
jgi:phage-related protein